MAFFLENVNQLFFGMKCDLEYGGVNCVKAEFGFENELIFSISNDILVYWH